VLGGFLPGDGCISFVECGEDRELVSDVRILLMTTFFRAHPETRLSGGALIFVSGSTYGFLMARTQITSGDKKFAWLPISFAVQVRHATDCMDATVRTHPHGTSWHSSFSR
jgi:hypothetical protein